MQFRNRLSLVYLIELRYYEFIERALSDALHDDLLDISNVNRLHGRPHDGNCLKNETYISSIHVNHYISTTPGRYRQSND